MKTTLLIRRHRLLPFLALLAVVVVVLPAASAATGPDNPSRGPHAAHLGSHTEAAHSDASHAEAPAQGRLPAAAPAEGTAVALRLEALLGQHSVLAADMMRGRIRGAEDFVQAANSALGKNTDAMTELVRSLFDEPTARRFSSTWAAHVAALLSYAPGPGQQENVARGGARAALTTFERELAGFFADASQGRLSRDAAQGAAQMHIDHLLQQADAFAAGDYATANRLYREGYQHTYRLGKTIAAALLPPDQAAALEAPTWRLRSELGRLLAEHVALVVNTTRAGVLNSPDFSAATEAVNGNTRDLAGAMDSLFGASAASTFQSMWADHVDQIMTYTTGVVTNDRGRRDEAVRKLGEFEARFAALLNGATSQRLDAPTLAKALLMHDQMLLGHADAFAAKDYQKAHDTSYSTFEHMFELAGQLSDAFGATVAARLPKGGAETGLGGTAGAVRRR